MAEICIKMDTALLTTLCGRAQAAGEELQDWILKLLVSQTQEAPRSANWEPQALLRGLGLHNRSIPSKVLRLCHILTHLSDRAFRFYPSSVAFFLEISRDLSSFEEAESLAKLAGTDELLGRIGPFLASQVDRILWGEYAHLPSMAGNKIGVICFLRAILDLGLPDAKKIADAIFSLPAPSAEEIAEFRTKYADLLTPV